MPIHVPIVPRHAYSDVHVLGTPMHVMIWLTSKSLAMLQSDASHSDSTTSSIPVIAVGDDSTSISL